MTPTVALAGALLGLAALVAGVYLLAGVLGLGIALCAVGAGLIGACVFVVDVKSNERKRP